MRPIALAIAPLLCSIACKEEPDSVDPYDVDAPQVGPYDVTIRWTDHGVPHLIASDHGSLGFGMGLVMAEHHGCTLADQFIKVNGERSRYLGAGPSDAYLDEDFGWRAVGVREQAEAWWETLSDTGRDRFVGFAAGYNEALSDARFPAACLAEPWVNPVDHLDVLTYMVALGLDGSFKVFIREIGRAAPPGGSPTGRRAPEPTVADLMDPKGAFQQGLAQWRAELHDPGRGSNGWSIGSERSTSGGGLLLSNTHFPAWGEKRWFESHLTIPGRMDVYGASLIGVPAINIGFNRHVAWTHTVSYAPRFTAYALTLDPDDPTRYVVDGETRSMTSEVYEREVLQEDGSLQKVSRTLYASTFGPVIDVPGVGWTSTLAVSVRDVNLSNDGLFDVWHGMNVAESMDDLLAAHTEHQGIPWVYTIAASKEGEVLFADTSRTPYLTQAQWDAWETWRAGTGFAQILANQFYDQAGAVALPAEGRFAWTEDLSTVTPGLVPPSLWPLDERQDYAFNANDSPWLHNASEPLVGLLPTYGPARTPRSARTRMNGLYLHETGAGSASGEDGTFTLEEVATAAQSMRAVYPELALDDVIARCDGVTSVSVGGEDVDPSPVCDALKDWSGTYTTDATGAVAWRTFLEAWIDTEQVSAHALNASGAGLFAVPFDPDDPLGTPRDLVAAPASGDDPVLLALARATTVLSDAGLSAAVPLGDVQRMPFLDGTDAAVPGANYWEGTIGIADWSSGATTTAFEWIAHPGYAAGVTERTVDGRYLMNNGNSYMLAVGFTDRGPEAQAVSTYSQSTDVDSPFLHDQSAIYASGALREVVFAENDVDEKAVEIETLGRGETTGF